MPSDLLIEKAGLPKFETSLAARLFFAGGLGKEVITADPKECLKSMDRASGWDKKGENSLI